MSRSVAGGETSIDQRLRRARAGDKGALARLLSIVENGEPGSAELMRGLYPQTGTAEVIGVTGPPGGGKSTLVSLLAGAYRARGDRVAVVAVDPSSPFSGGAILGDRIRMRDRFLDEGIFIRSMASRGHAGGLASATVRVVNVLDALGTGVILVETVGVGQEEVDVMRLADTVCLVTLPGLGDDIQAIKAGVLEIADVIVVNKADRPGADETARDLAQALSLGAPRRPKGRIIEEEDERERRAASPRGVSPPSPERVSRHGREIEEDWKPPIVRTSALDGAGLDELVAAIATHAAWSRASGERERRRREAARAEVEGLLREQLVRRLADRIGLDRVEAAIDRVAGRAVDPYSAVDELLAER